MISKILSILVLGPLAILLVVFCVANRAPVPVSLDPIGTLPQFVYEVPLFVLLIGAVIAGLILGGFGTWVTQRHYRAKASRRADELENLRHEVEVSKERMRRLREEQSRVAAGPAIAAPGETRPALAGPAAA
ncbi:LapA family protein [Aureimonas sp. SK2]|uniref:LapA family protein n=1 Tax=Aureimonas sp. SK2 TaxID=3015992 RepID=UPI0024437465|nr:LapA family protein [Aureimonas sp. SK2]